MARLRWQVNASRIDVFKFVLRFKLPKVVKDLVQGFQLRSHHDE